MMLLLILRDLDATQRELASSEKREEAILLADFLWSFPRKSRETLHSSRSKLLLLLTNTALLKLTNKRKRKGNRLRKHIVIARSHRSDLMHFGIKYMNKKIKNSV